MPILDLQKRLREVGRIRLGDTVEANGRNGTYRRPVKLETFRFTSRDRQVIEAAAKLYGGEPGPWAEQTGQWQVTTTTDVLPVIVPPSEMSFSQWFELWSGGGCERRCDSRWEMIGNRECVCDPEARDCKATTRLSVMLPDLAGLGVWRVESHGYYAAVEIGGAVDVCQAVAARGQHLPARLRLEHREVKRVGKDGRPETRKFAVPVLDVDVAPGALTSVGTPVAVGRPITELPGAVHEAIEHTMEIEPGFTPAFTPVPTAELQTAPSIADQVSDSANRPRPTPRKNAATPLPPTGAAPRTAAQANEKTCSRCGQAYGDKALVRGGGGESKFVHRDCETSGPDDPGSTTGAESKATRDHKSEGLRLDGQTGEDASESSPARSPADGITARDIGQEAVKVWPTDELPKRQAGKERDRRRYTLTRALTNGPVHCGDLTPRQRYQVWKNLNDIATGVMGCEVTDDGLVITRDGHKVQAPWWNEADSERGAA